MPKLDETNNDENNELNNEQQFDEQDNLDNNEEIQDNHEEEVEEFSEEELARLMKTSDEKLRAMGITDDPKQWKPYQKYADRVKKEAKQKEVYYQNIIAQNSTQFEALRNQIQQNTPPVEKKETLVKPVPPQMPEKPSDFNWADVPVADSPSRLYMDKVDDFNKKQSQYLHDLDTYTSTNLDIMSKTTTEMQERAIKQQQLEAMKTDAISRFMKAGLTPVEAQQCWKEATENATNFYTPENVAQMFKLRKGVKSNGKNLNQERFNARKDKNDKFGTPPGLGRANIDYDKPEHYTKNSDHSDWYKIKGN
jgi:hypothetical protein